MSRLVKKVIFDNIHGDVILNQVESRILETLYYQRLRWVRQLGFTFYIFPGATHTRHAHTLGVLHVMERVLRSIGKAVTEDRLFDPKFQDEATRFHRTMRLAAMLHDIGAFPFSHTIELGYVAHWRKQNKNKKTKYVANHENLGVHIIQNTDFPGGITRILKEEGIDPQELARIIEGTSSNMLANQLVHSDIDVDRMDYLLRDAHHTGVQLGSYDLNMLVRSLTVHEEKGREFLCIKEDNIHVVDSFLSSRYFWYSQIINDGTGYKFDLIAAKIYEYFLENGLAYSFDHLIDSVSLNPYEYFTFNDSYFMAKLHEYLAGRIMHPMIRELSEMLANRNAPSQIKLGPAKPILIVNEEHRRELVQKVMSAVEWLKTEINAIDPQAWIIFDIPTKDVMFTKSQDLVGKESKTSADKLQLRDPVKVLTRQGELKLLIDVSSSLMSVLNQYRNFIPRIYVSPRIFEALQKNKVLEKMHEKEFDILSA